MSQFERDYIVVIPARAGSQRIVDKNNQKIGNKSLVEWAIDCALTLFSKNRIVLVTDSVVSANTGKGLGIEVISRPPEISGASSSTESVIEHVYEHYPSENYVLLQPTSPFRTKSDLKICIRKFEEFDVLSVMSATIPWNTIKDLYAVEDETLETFRPVPLPKNLSNLKCYFDTGAIYIFSTKIIFENNSIIDAAHTLAVKTNPMSFFDIDHQFHLDLANSYFSIDGWDFDT